MALTHVKRAKKMDNKIKLLKKQIMISQFSHVAGCSAEQALQILQSARWNYEVKISDHAVLLTNLSAWLAS